MINNLLLQILPQYQIFQTLWLNMKTFQDFDFLSGHSAEFVFFADNQSKLYWDHRSLTYDQTILGLKNIQTPCDMLN